MNIKILSRYLTIFLLCVGGMVEVLAQESTSTLTGKIVDDQGAPLANVLVESFEGAGRVFTDADGNFSVEVDAKHDELILTLDGFKRQTLTVDEGALEGEASITLKQLKAFGGANEVTLPYQDFSEIRSVSATSMITGEELLSYPTESLIEALSGRLPGVVIENAFSNGPGRTTNLSYVRGNIATFYVDGVQRDPSYLSVYEVDKVYVFKDLSSRASLGISGAGPVLWIITKKGESYNKQINVSVEHGVTTPTETPQYLDAYNYAVLRNESNENDGLDPIYSDEALAAYKSGSDPLRYPNVDYYDKYLKDAARFTRANVNFSGGDSKVNYFTMLDYTGSGGMEAVGQESTYNRYNARANVNLFLTKFLSMNVNLSAALVDSKYPNRGGFATFMDLYSYLPLMPANAHPNSYNGQLFSSANYPVNVENELLNGKGHGQTLNTQNNATLQLDLGSILDGLTFTATGAFDVNNQLDEVTGGTSELYRLTQGSQGQDSIFRFTPAVVDGTLANGYDYYRRVTSVYSRFNYNNTFNRHSVSAHLSYYQSSDETKNIFGSEQPFRIQDLSFRTNYMFDKKYIAQVDLSYTGSMRLPEGERFGLYPTVGAGWILSEEGFLQGASAINFLKLYGSYGVMAYNGQSGYLIQNGNIVSRGFGLDGVNEFYLTETLWQQLESSGFTFGTFTERGAGINVYSIAQQGSSDYELPKRKYLNIGLQTELFNAISFEANYFHINNSGELSRRSSQVPDLFGSSGFIPLTNFGETVYSGVDGMIAYTKKNGDFKYSIGLNGVYRTGKYVVVDEPVDLADYRKYAGTSPYEIRGYISEGLFQSETEISERDVTQSWGALQPGDIRYKDINNDGVVNEQDITTTGYDRPHIFYGLNIGASYKGFGLFVQGQGVADGYTMLNSPYYFWMEGEQADQIFANSPNYSEVMLDRYPVTNDYPRLSTTSNNNYQRSTFWLEKASYFRLKNVEVSYTLPKAISSKLAMTNARVFLRGKNLLVISELTDKYGISPENQYAGAGSFPIMKTFTGGFTCRF